MELAVGIASVLLTALIAYAVHVYRPKIGYELQCADDKFYVAGERICHDGEGLWDTIEIGTITLTNPSSSDVENFEIVFEGRFKQAKFRIEKTSTVSKDVIKFENSPVGLRVSAKRFPKKEEVSVRYSIIDSSGIKYVKPKKYDGKFELYSLDERRRAIKFFVSGFLIPLYFIPIGIAGALIFRFIADLK